MRSQNRTTGCRSSAWLNEKNCMTRDLLVSTKKKAGHVQGRQNPCKRARRVSPGLRLPERESG